MKKIINGKMYNTETAKEVVTWSNITSEKNYGTYNDNLLL